MKFHKTKKCKVEILLTDLEKKCFIVIIITIFIFIRNRNSTRPPFLMEESGFI